MRLYFDNNVYNRPFDNQAIERNRAETDAVWTSMSLIEAGQAELASSFVVELEHSSLVVPVRRRVVRGLISLAQVYVESSPDIFERASELERHGLTVNDALHFAVAERAEADYFVTCDDKLSKRARGIRSSLKVALPTELIEYEGL